MTSQQLAECMHTNSVVVRRTMAGLRKAGLVRSEKGHGGGWSVACDLHAVTLLDIYIALGEPDVFAIGNRTASPACLVEQAVNNALTEALTDAAAVLTQRLGSVSLAALAAEFRKESERRKRGGRRTAYAR